MKSLLLMVLLAGVVRAADVEWTRFKGKVKFIDQSSGRLTLENGDGDTFVIKLSDDVSILYGKSVKLLGDLLVDDKITLLKPRRAAPTPKDADEPAPGGVYKPVR